MPKSIFRIAPFAALGIVVGIGLVQAIGTPAHQDPESPPSGQIEISNTVLHPATGPARSNTGSSSTSLDNPRTIGSRSIQSSPVSASQSGAVKQNDRIITRDGKTYPLRTYKTMLTPDDPSYNQWWVSSNGMTTVWDTPAGSPAMSIAVIDTGFALEHQEFADRWLINSGESGSTISENPSDLNCTDQSLPLNKSCNNIDDNYDGILDNESGAASKENPSDLNCTDQSLPLNKSCNNIDDDGNGLIDDYRGYDFSNFDASAQAGEINAAGSGTTHGTMVAGVLGANGNNGTGIAGVNWNVKILPLQAIDDNGYGDSYTVGEAIYYAADQDVDIINLSLGTEFTDPYLRTAILYALDRGVLIVAASGNDGCDCISYPANYPEVVAVGALATSGNPASFSNYGQELDILAPGQSMTAPVYSPSNQVSAYAAGSGTSFATPFISGMLAHGKAVQPDAAWEEIIGAMFENSNRDGLTVSAPRSNTLGFGKTMAADMLNRLSNPISEVQRYQFSGGTITGSNKSYQCNGSTIPATRYYELKKSGAYRYTANLRELSKYQQLGWTSRPVAYVCIGLGTDSIDILRAIDIPSETLNLRLKQ